MHSNESSVIGRDETQTRKCAFSELSEVQFDSAAARGVFTEGTDNFSQADSSQSANNTFSTLPFDPVMLPYVSTLPASISQHSLFTLPKPITVTSTRKTSLDSQGSLN